MRETRSSLEHIQLDRRGFGKLALFGAAATASMTIPAKPAAARERPDGEQGAAAEALADKMLAAVDQKAWQATGAITWKFGRNVHLWDRRRNFCRVQKGNKTILVDIASKRGIALKRDKRVEGDRAAKWVEKAWASWANDSFWLNPVVKIRDGGTSRALVSTEDGEQGLLVTYASGGVTPGDAYLWLVDESGRPYEWQLWVSILPVGGMRFSWEEWTKISTGAWISQYHDGLFNIRIKELAAAPTLEKLVGPKDPFLPLLDVLK